MGRQKGPSAGEELLRRFYAAFAAADGAGMTACYTDDATFSDPVYPGLDGPEVGAMWRMLMARARDLRIELEEVHADDAGGRATWTAHYAFGPDRRPVANRVRSTFELREGRIRGQHDVFDFHGWAAMAFGLPGRLLGWTPWFRARVQREAAQQLRAFRAVEDAAPPAS